MIHRDLKPDNIIFSDSENFLEFCIIDFGLATNISDEPWLHVKCGSPGIFFLFINKIILIKKKKII